MQFKVGFKSDIGMKRKQNQDNGGAFPELGLFVVADGMGGHQGGETASSMVIKVLPQIVAQAESTQNWNPRRVITDAITEANRSIYKVSEENPQLRGMGTTTTTLLFRGETLVVGHVGDSRCYFIRPRALWQMTRDHSLVQEKLRAGLITREQLKTDRMKNVITRSVGFEPDLNVELYTMEVSHGDTFLLCSDGLTGLVEDFELMKIIQESLFDKKEDIQTTVEQLIRAANEKGGDDNVTALMIQVVTD